MVSFASKNALLVINGNFIEYQKDAMVYTSSYIFFFSANE